MKFDTIAKSKYELTACSTAAYSGLDIRLILIKILL